MRSRGNNRKITKKMDEILLIFYPVEIKRATLQFWIKIQNILFMEKGSSLNVLSVVSV